MRVWFSIILVFLIGRNAWASPVNATSEGVAIDGYDTVAYFTEGKAIKGERSFSTEFDGIQWWFASAENLSAFQVDPRRYVPAYAGHCANGLSDGHLVRGNPEIFRIIDGRLYLFFSWWGKAQWKYNQEEQIELATKNWRMFSEQTGVQ